MNIFELSASLTLDKKNYENGLNQAESQANKSGRTISGVFNELGNSAEDSGQKVEGLSDGFSVMKGAIANVAGNLLSSAVDGIKNLAGEAINSSDSLKKFESTMQFAGYDGKQINRARDDMKEYADKTVYDLQTISNTTAQLAANGIPNYEKLTEAAGNLNAVAGGNSDTFRSVAMMLTQTAGAGKLTTENWNQLANAIPGASGKVQEALKKNGAYTGDFRDAMSKGQITADEFNKAIMDLGFTDAAEQAATSTDTFEGAVGNMQAAVTDGLMKIYDAIGSENITGFINELSDMIATIIPPIATAVGWFVDNLPKIAPLLAGIAAGLGVFAAVEAAIKGITIVQTALNAVMLANPILLIVALIAGLVAAFVTLWNTSDSFRNFWIGLWDGIKAIVGAVVGAIVGFFTETLPNGIQVAINWFANLPSNIANFLGQALTAIGSWVGHVGKAMAKVGKAIINGIKHLPKAMLNWGKDMIQGLINGIKSMIGHVGNAVKGVADKIKNFLHFSRPDEGPLREYEEWMPDMINGMSNSLKKASPSLINQAKALASDMSDSLKIDGTINSDISELHQIPEDLDQSSRSVASNPMSDTVSAFKQALSEMKIEMDGDEMGKFVDKTVTNLVYA